MEEQEKGVSRAKGIVNVKRYKRKKDVAWLGNNKRFSNARACRKVAES